MSARLPGLLAAPLAALALLAVVGAGELLADPSVPPVPAPTPVPVVSSQLVCPAPIAQGSKVDTAVTLADAALPGLPPAPPNSPPGEATVGALGSGQGVDTRTLTEPGSADGFRVQNTSVGPVVAEGTGSLAPGLGADQLTRGNDGPMRGLAAQPCGPAVSDAWFIGGGSGVGHTTRLFLSNVDEEPAEVDVQLWGTAGPVDAPAARGIVVAPRSRVALSVSTLAPGQALVAMHMQARVGRVSPAVLDNQVDGNDPQGLEYLPMTDASRRVVLPAVLAGDGRRDLVLLCPGDDTEVAVSMLTTDGAITPVGLKSVSLNAGRVKRVRVDPVTAGAVSGFVLTADRPIVAGVHMRFAAELADTADVAGTPALTGPAVVSGLFATQSNALLMVAPRGPARVRLTTYGVGGTTGTTKPVTTEVSVVAGAVRVVPVVVPAGSAWAWVQVEPDPAAGPVHMVRRSSEPGTRGQLVTTTPVLPLRPVADIPAAVYRLGADAASAGRDGNAGE
ncbi:MAG TPA: DUF5719 family protein [Candidatus Nanopelagicales bacterium]|nr:DUF5719 family protein [Candidatus Nanopelagicales bacterium]